MMKSLSLTILTSIIFITLSGCSTHEVDTVEEWCEQISGANLAEKYQPFWAVIFAVKFNGDAIRDDYVKLINSAYLEKVDGRTEKMAWREGTDFHIINLSSLLVVDPEKIIEEWRNGIEMSKEFKYADQASKCLYGTLTSAFDSLHIHSMTSDVFGKNWTENETVILTDRKERLGDNVI